MLAWLNYRDRALQGEKGAQSSEVSEIVEKLREHDQNAVLKLRDLDVKGMAQPDFELLIEALAPYISRDVADFYCTVARSSERLRPHALEALRSILKQADLIMVESDLEGNRDEIEQIYFLVADSDINEILLAAVAEGREPDRRNSLDIIGSARILAIGDELFTIYEGSDLPVREKIFPVLCRLGDPRVERDLLKRVEEIEPARLKDIVSLFVNSKSKRCRKYLIGLVRGEINKKHYPRLMDRLSMEIGKSGNAYMAPVLKEIFSLRSNRQSSSMRPRLSFAKKIAILNFVKLKGEENLSSRDRKAIKKAIEKDPQLKHYREIRKYPSGS